VAQAAPPAPIPPPNAAGSSDDSLHLDFSDPQKRAVFGDRLLQDSAKRGGDRSGRQLAQGLAERQRRLERAGEVKRPDQSSKLPKIVAFAVVTMAVLVVAALLLGPTLSSTVPGLIEQVTHEEPNPPKVGGHYTIVSNPKGATVYVDGKKQKGLTPIDVEIAPGSEARVDVKLYKHGTVRRMVESTEHTGVEELTFSLSPSGSLRITSKPSGAPISVDGFEIVGARTPGTLDDIPAGKQVEVSVKLRGKPFSKKVQLEVGGSKTVHFDRGR
jgi:hypothetical protein